MKFIIISFFMVTWLLSSTIKSEIISINKAQNFVSIKINQIDVGMSGFLVHEINDEHSIILKAIKVKSFNKKTKIANLEISDFDLLKSNALPNGQWKIEVGDTAILAYGYSRAFFISPSETIYYKIIKGIEGIHWIHPDIFASMLLFEGHSSPAKSDFKNFSHTFASGILFIFIDGNIYTLDTISLAILNISKTNLKSQSYQAPFYSRIQETGSNWWGDGSEEIEDYDYFYYSLLLEANKDNKKLKKIIKESDKKFHSLLR